MLEPLCFYFPFHDPGVPRPQPERNPQMITKVVISSLSTDTHGVLELVSQGDRLLMLSDKEHLMEITLDHHESGRMEDYRPAMPLILCWWQICYCRILIDASYQLSLGL